MTTTTPVSTLLVTTIGFVSEDGIQNVLAKSLPFSRDLCSIHTQTIWYVIHELTNMQK